MALARFFDAIDDVISSSSTISMPTGDFTFAAWVYPQSAGENNAGFIIQCLGGLAVARFRFAASTRTLTAVANHDGGTNATSTTTTTLSTNTWQLAIATYRASDKKMRVFIGSATSAMAEASYATQTA